MLVIIPQLAATLITVMELSIVKTVCEYSIYFILSQIIIYERIIIQPSTITNIVTMVLLFVVTRKAIQWLLLAATDFHWLYCNKNYALIVEEHKFCND